MHRVDSFIDPRRCLLDGYLATLGVNPREDPEEGELPVELPVKLLVEPTVKLHGSGLPPHSINPGERLAH